MINTIIEYYEELKNEIDLFTEESLINNIDQKDELNSNRSKIIEKINEILKLNLDFVDSEKCKNYPSEYFAPKYCYSLSENGKWKLVVLNQYYQ